MTPLALKMLTVPEIVLGEHFGQTDKDNCNIASRLRLPEQVRGSNLSKIVIFGVHNLCGVAFLMQKKKVRNLFSLRSYCKFPFFCVTHYLTVERCF